MRSGRKKKLVYNVAMYLAEKWSIPTPKEYNSDPNRPDFTNLKEIKKVVGGWDILLKMIKVDYPELWELTQPKKEDPLAKLRASSVEK